MKSISKEEYEVVFKDGAKVVPSEIQGKLKKKYTLNEVGLAFAGTLSRSDKPEEAGLWFTPASGQKIELVNRPAKDDDDKPEDVVSKLDAALQDGKATAKVAGVLVEKDGKLSMQLASAEVVEKTEK
ncbi:MAG: hypothetical protein HYY18_04625 [Planctomycetes bacterium]|nr:hypothetical protein [Planctomycetota bacterium]